MKTHKWIIILSFISTIAFFGAKESYRKNGVISQKDLKICELEKKMNIFNTITDSIERVDNTKKAKKFNFVFNSMKKYNPDIDKETVSLFISVTEKFNLDSTELLFNTCLSQILKESGAQQYYCSTHPKAGELVVSSSKAIGISQITIATCYDYLKSSYNSNDSLILLNLGCDDFSFIKNNDYPDIKDNLFKWLKNEKNNIILWGYIMKKSLIKRNGNLKYALISYNRGPEYLIDFMTNGFKPESHNYVKQIKKIRLALGA